MSKNKAGINQVSIVIEEISASLGLLRVEGTLDWSNFAKVENGMETLFEKGIFRVVVNLEKTTYISSAGFGCFIGSLDKAIRNKGNIIFASVPKDIRDVFRLLGLNKILRFADTQDEAIGMIDG